MISILYPKDDFDAANVAVKVQALAQSKNQKVYVVPKHYGRNKAEIQMNLSKTKTALFIIQTAEKVDRGTIDELNLLMEYKAQIVGFIPHNVRLTSKLSSYINLQKYNRGDSNSLKSSMMNFISSKQTNDETKNSILIVIGLVVLLILLSLEPDD